ncbi:MAG: saccharopine dehydrogenase NADP-binding domain-containing protein [Gemmatimonadales bacterium]|nr:saccharopine dehydrogenase NADP-binding domain-containing protein [Gemmatimonadales bacterium]MDQ3427673.1 saccharopine dehydrogenase NADP-binding domain-containing protein [Gemmatimonadota bacterium]
MKMVVLGAGLQGCACAYDLLQSPAVTQVTLADLRPDTLPSFLAGEWGGRLRLVRLDVTDHAAVREVLAGQASVMSALPYYFNGPMARAAVEMGCHFSDLGGNTEIVLEQKKLHDQALAKGVSVIPDCGLAPGMVNILAAEGIRRLDPVERVKVFVGGLPQHPEPPLNYQIVYSLEGALDYYTTPSWILRGGKAVQVDALSELESVEFPAPVGTLEAFHTGGGISTLPFAYQGKVDVMEYKTLRYPGHVAIMRPIRELGLLDSKPIEVKGQPVVPRDLFIAAVRPKLHKPQGQDLVALQVQVTGQKGGKRAQVTFRLIDYYDTAHGISAMMRATGYSLSLTGQMQADGRVTLKGVHTPDEAMPFGAYVSELGLRGVRIEEL